MDIVTQGLLGAAMAQAAAPRSQSRAATVVGCFAGVLPDADALLRSPTDPLQFLEWHRHFTHALLFVPAGALIATLLLAPFFVRRLGFARLYLYAFLGYALSGLLDACTSYGTLLWWPFSDERVAWSIISIVDPIFSLALLAGVVVAAAYRRTGPARAALVLCAGYLALGLMQHERALAVASDLASTRGETPARLLVKPTFANVILWRSVYIHAGEPPQEPQLRVDALWLSPLGDHRIYAGESLPLVGPDPPHDWAPGEALARNDFRRFAHFANNYLVRHPARPEMIGDARFAMLPTSLLPLWGIVAPVVGRAAAGNTRSEHARFITDRSLSPGARERFWSMLLGRH